MTTYMAHSLGLMDGGSIDLVSLQQSSAAVASLGEKMAPTVPAEIVPQFGVVRKMVATSAAGVKPDWKASEIDIPMSDEQARAWEAVQLYKGC
ncbi:hypothetical protein [Kibdelosporangium philippinense]|uniref:hypothetical protein n=1 Tax=Kibdelosporangium philippinense TaxID=211113 RepID=UPI0036154186